MATSEGGRPNQRRRTRKDLLSAAARLVKQGRKPSLDEIAEEAMVSRATAYRYFPGVEPLLLEAALDLEAPDPDALFADDASTDPAARMAKVETAFHEMMLANEAGLRLMLAQSMQRIVSGDLTGDIPPRQNRRTPLIEAALAPAKDQFRPADYGRLRKALALVVGTEGMLVTKDVLQLPDDEARAVKLWAIRALVEAAKVRR